MMSKTLRALSFLSVHRFVEFLQVSVGHDDAGPSESGSAFGVRFLQPYLLIKLMCLLYPLSAIYLLPLSGTSLYAPLVAVPLNKNTNNIYVLFIKKSNNIVPGFRNLSIYIHNVKL